MLAVAPGHPGDHLPHGEWRLAPARRPSAAEEAEDDADSILDEIPQDMDDLIWERAGEGRWVITSRPDLAYQGLRGLFAEANEMDAAPVVAPAAVSKIQALFRGHASRKVFRAARILTALVN